MKECLLYGCLKDCHLKTLLRGQAKYKVSGSPQKPDEWTPQHWFSFLTSVRQTATQETCAQAQEVIELCDKSNQI